MTKRAPAFARVFQGRWRIAEMISSNPRTLPSSARIAANWSLVPSRRISMSATVRATVRPAPSSHRRVPTTIPTPADAARQPSALPAASSATSSYTKAMIQALSPNASEFINGLLDAFARTGKYFTQHQWRQNGTMDLERAAKAIRALGGTYTITWEPTS
jgi:hypothetical protein